MKPIVKAWVCSAALIAAPALAQEGENLFEYHGCIHCHGAEGKNPVIDAVPSIAGEPAEGLFRRAKRILSGEGASKESKIMHAAFYSPAQCDAPPSDDDLRAITDWISTR
jgi:cytochrome c553